MRVFNVGSLRRVTRDAGKDFTREVCGLLYKRNKFSAVFASGLKTCPLLVPCDSFGGLSCIGRQDAVLRGLACNDGLVNCDAKHGIIPAIVRVPAEVGEMVNHVMNCPTARQLVPHRSLITSARD
jgi:hypothetical protein